MKLKVRSVMVENEWGNVPVFILAEFIPKATFKDLLRRGVIYKETDYNSRKGFVWAVSEEKAKMNNIELEEI